MVGKNLSHYKIESELGRGGMGVVYKARDSRLNRDVALKVLAEHLIRDESSHERFMQEARAVAALSHANICTLFDIGDDEGKQFLVMEFVPGESLQDVISRGNIPVEDAQRFLYQYTD